MVLQLGLSFRGCVNQALVLIVLIPGPVEAGILLYTLVL